MKTNRSWVLILLFCVDAIAATTHPASRPATRPAPSIAPEAKPILERVRNAYAAEKPLTVEGAITGDFDVASRQHKYKLTFTAQADGRGQFVHRAADIGTLVRDRANATVYDQKSNTFGAVKSPARRASIAEVPAMVSDILEDENPAILCMLLTNPEDALLNSARRVTGDQDRLLIETAQDRRTVTLDAAGHIREMTIDFTPLLRQRGAEQIGRATVVLTYTRIDRSTPVEASAFEFEIPRGATEFDMEPRKPDEDREELMRRLPVTGPATAPATSD